MNWYMYAMIIAVVLVIFAGILWNILKSPFSYPYYDKDFNVSGKRNPEINDFIDKYICKYGLCPFSNHYKKVEEWKEFNRKFIEKCRLKNLRKKQLDEAIDDTHMFRFHLVRNQTRYRQKNYVKSSYVVRISIDDRTYSFDWIQQRFAALELIGFECSLSEYASIEQRKLMTKELRNKIAIRDNYTCQICGKYMPDGVGLHIDHIIPVSKGGKSVPSNLQVLCSKCNGSKSSKCKKIDIPTPTLNRVELFSDKPKENDKVEIMVEKSEYAIYGIHSGDVGYIVGECVTGGKWWVRFTIYDENKKLNVEIAVVENDFKIINY